jgi:hypothetical protein
VAQNAPPVGAVGASPIWRSAGGISNKGSKQNASAIELFIICALLDTIFLWRNDDLHPLLHRFFDNGIGVVSFISQQCIGEKAVNQADSFFAIRAGTFSESDSNRQTMRIHGQMYLGVEPPFVRLIS